MIYSEHKISNAKINSLVVAGNILDYYDFLLFAHLGPIITPLFFPGVELITAHLLSLFLFGLSFVIRPLGGYIFGRISDIDGRKIALIKTIKWAIFPTVALALLPTYETLGIGATVAFVFLRLFQGFSLGGEYPNAGTYLMEYNPDKNRGLISGILGGSGTIGSLIGLGMAFLCLQEDAPSWLWRAAFLLGSLGGFVSYIMRKNLIEIMNIPEYYPPMPPVPSGKRFLVVMIGVFVGITVWLPSTYSNFYVTKIMGYSTQEGVIATLTALIGYIVLTPLFGAISDRFGHYRTMLWASVAGIPMGFFSFFMLYQGNIVTAQIGLIGVAAAFGAPIHVIMNSVFPKETRGRSVGLLFMSGLSIGGLAPSLIGYVVNHTVIQAAPAFLLSSMACLAAITLLSCRSFVINSRVENAA